MAVIDRLLSSKKGQFFMFGATELISFFVICANYRAVAQGSYVWSGLTDFMLLILNGALGKLAMDDSRARSWAAVAGTTLGGTVGTLLSIFVTKHLYGA